MTDPRPQSPPRSAPDFALTDAQLAFAELLGRELARRLDGPDAPGDAPGDAPAPATGRPGRTSGPAPGRASQRAPR